MIGAQRSRANPLLMTQISQLQTQVSHTLDAYQATGNQSSLVKALQLQSEIAQVLLDATALNSPALVAQNDKIKRLV